MGAQWPLVAVDGPRTAGGGDVVRRALDRSEREVHELRSLVCTINLLAETYGREPGSAEQLAAAVRAAIDDHRQRMHRRLRLQQARIGAVR